CAPQATAEIDLLPEHEEVRIEAADLLERHAPEEQRRADDERAGRPAPAQQRAVEAAWAAAADRRRPCPPARRQAHERDLLPAVQADQPRADRTRVGASLGRREQGGDRRLVARPRIRVEDEDEASRGGGDPPVRSRAEAEILAER